MFNCSLVPTTKPRGGYKECEIKSESRARSLPQDYGTAFGAPGAAFLRDVASFSGAARNNVKSPPAVIAARSFPSGEKFSDRISSETPGLLLVKRLRIATDRKSV